MQTGVKSPGCMKMTAHWPPHAPATPSVEEADDDERCSKRSNPPSGWCCVAPTRFGKGSPSAGGATLVALLLSWLPILCNKCCGDLVAYIR